MVLGGICLEKLSYLTHPDADTKRNGENFATDSGVANISPLTGTDPFGELYTSEVI